MVEGGRGMLREGLRRCSLQGEQHTAQPALQFVFRKTSSLASHSSSLFFVKFCSRPDLMSPLPAHALCGPARPLPSSPRRGSSAGSNAVLRERAGEDNATFSATNPVARQTAFGG